MSKQYTDYKIFGTKRGRDMEGHKVYSSMPEESELTFYRDTMGWSNVRVQKRTVMVGDWRPVK